MALRLSESPSETSNTHEKKRFLRCSVPMFARDKKSLPTHDGSMLEQNSEQEYDDYVGHYKNVMEEIREEKNRNRYRDEKVKSDM